MTFIDWRKRMSSRLLMLCLLLISYGADCDGEPIVFGIYGWTVWSWRTSRLERGGRMCGSSGRFPSSQPFKGIWTRSSGFHFFHLPFSFTLHRNSWYPARLAWSFSLGLIVIPFSPFFFSSSSSLHHLDSFLLLPTLFSPIFYYVDDDDYDLGKMVVLDVIPSTTSITSHQPTTTKKLYNVETNLKEKSKMKPSFLDASR